VNPLGDQLWLALEEADARVNEVVAPRARDQVVRLLQDEVREGREASEAGDSSVGRSSKTQ